MSATAFKMPLTEDALVYALGEFPPGSSLTLVCSERDELVADRIVFGEGPLHGACRIEVNHRLKDGHWELRTNGC